MLPELNKKFMCQVDQLLKKIICIPFYEYKDKT